MLRTKVIAVAGWLFLGAVFGPPVVGATSTLFWNEAADGSTAVGVAWRVYDRAYPPTVGPTYVSDEGRLPDVSLGGSCWLAYEQSLAAADMGTLMLQSLIRVYSARQLARLLQSTPAYDALLAMPRPLLGALDACIGGTPIIGPLCLGYVRRLSEKAEITQSKTKAAIISKVRREVEAIWCAAVKPSGVKGR